MQKNQEHGGSMGLELAVDCNGEAWVIRLRNALLLVTKRQQGK